MKFVLPILLISLIFIGEANAQTSSPSYGSGTTTSNSVANALGYTPAQLDGTSKVPIAQLPTIPASQTSGLATLSQAITIPWSGTGLGFSGAPSATSLALSLPMTGPDVQDTLYSTAAGDGTTDDSVALNTLAAAVPASGGVLHISYKGTGVYLIQSQQLLLHSNTTMVCDPGVVLKEGTSTSFGNMVTNVNANASVITDHDITIENCAATDAKTVPGGDKAFVFRAVERPSIINPICTNEGDCTAFELSDHTLVQNGHATGITNACWDHWDGDTNISVIGGYCSSSLYGVLITGTNTAQNTAEQTIGGAVSGGNYVITGVNGGGVVLNGLGTTGSGVTHVNVSGVSVAYTGTSTTGQDCISISGTTQYNQINVNCVGGIFSLAGDSGGYAQYNAISGSITSAYTGTGAAVNAIGGTAFNTISGVTVSLGSGSLGESFFDAGVNYWLSNTPAQGRTSILGGAYYLDTSASYGVFGIRAHVASTQGTAPTTSNGTLNATATDAKGTVTEGTSSTGTVITFHTAYQTVPDCSISSPTGSATTSYTPATTTLTIVNASATGDKFTYQCIQ